MYTQIAQQNAFIYSVFKRIIINESWIIINGWHDTDKKTGQYYCCLALANGRTVAEKIVIKNIFGLKPLARRNAIQYQCHAKFTNLDERKGTLLLMQITPT